MRRVGLLVSLSTVLVAYGCGGSGGGGTGGAGGTSAKGGAGGGSAGASGNAGATGHAGAGGGNAGASDNAGAGGGSAGASGSAGAGGGSAGTTGNGGAGGAVAACGDGTGQGDTCNTISGSAAGPCVVTTMSADTAPTALGGSVSNGTYELTSSTFYGTLPDGASSDDGDFGTHRETLLVYVQTATSFNLDQFRVSGTRQDIDQGTVAISGTTVTHTQTCPAPGDGGDSGGSAGFTATSSAFTLIETRGSGGILVKVYTKTSS